MDLMTLIVGVLIFFGGGVLVNSLSREIDDWLPSLRSWLLRCAVSRLPENDQRRWAEEWAAHMDECPGTYSKLILLIGVWFAAGGISRQAKREREGERAQPLSNLSDSQPSVARDVTETLLGASAYWTDERLETLKQLWAEGLSASQIARQLGGITRNAIIGKVHRLGLAGRATPARAERPRMMVARRVARPRPAPAIQVPIIEKDPVIDEHGRKTTVLTISDRMCKWPIGDPSTPEFHFCGHAPKAGSPYCDAHRAKAAYGKQ